MPGRADGEVAGLVGLIDGDVQRHGQHAGGGHAGGPPATATSAAWPNGSGAGAAAGAVAGVEDPGGVTGMNSPPAQSVHALPAPAGRSAAAPPRVATQQRRHHEDLADAVRTDRAALLPSLAISLVVAGIARTARHRTVALRPRRRPLRDGA